MHHLFVDRRVNYNTSRQPADMRQNICIVRTSVKTNLQGTAKSSLLKFVAVYSTIVRNFNLEFYRCN